MNKVEGVVSSVSDLVIAPIGGQGTPASASDDNGVIISGEDNSMDDNDDCSNDLNNARCERQSFQQGAATLIPPERHEQHGISRRPEQQQQQQQQPQQQLQQQLQHQRERQEEQPAQGVTESVFPHNQLKVLLVEDDDSTRHVVAALLRNCGYEVTAAASGLQAWEILQGRESSVDIVLTDLMMPGLSGLELLKKIIRRETSKRIPVVMMSSLDSMDVVLRCLSEGAVDFLVKPVRKNELKNLWQHFWRMCLSSSGSGSGSQTGKVAGNNSGSYGGLNVGDGSDNGSGTQSSWTKKPVEVQSHQEAGAAHAQPELVVPKRDKRDDEESCIPTVKEKKKNSNKVDSMNHASTSNAEPSCKDLLATIQNQAVVQDSGKGVLDNNDSTLDLSLKRSRLKEVEDVVANHESEQKFILHQSGGSAFSRYSNSPHQQPPNNTNSNSNTNNNNSNKFPMNLWLNVGGNVASGEKASEPAVDNLKVPTEAALSQFKVAASNFAAFSDMAAAYAQSLHQFFCRGTPPVPPWPPAAASPPPPPSDKCTAPQPHHHHHHHHHHFHGPTEEEVTVNNNNNNNNNINVNTINNETSNNNNNHATINNNNNNNNNTSNTTTTNNNNVVVNQRLTGLQHCGSSNVTGKVAEVSFGSSNANGNGNGNGSVNGSVSGSNNLSNNNVNGHSNGHSGAVLTAGNGDSGNNGSSKGNTTGITSAGNGNEAGIVPCPDSNTQLTRREVALYKFRQKRKERCFEKKVRYQSRKRLAEQRPRVRGQFVKQSALATAAEQAQGEEDGVAMEVDGEFEGEEHLGDCVL